ncbi:NAD(P)H-binding protein [Duganella sp. FT135W]|uniref:NAD(P)H-binding protein n=1 Tax=Duganella flavida TaxID=2692175 RepID=A0A6L8KHD0_9BURK|nr:NAD(P)-binding oxidoreductase [Duganella flavida]MYM26147.1 NAD(P)H-binding protein [Duganella flavida]
MKRYAVVGASSGTGKRVVAQLAASGAAVRAISRQPVPSHGTVESYAADVTDAEAIKGALSGGFDAVFFTVDIHGKGLTREQVKAVMLDGCVNTIAAAKAGGAGRFVLLSVMGADLPSWVWWLLNAMKPGMRDNIVKREKFLRDSGLPYVICRAPRLTDAENPMSVTASAPLHRMTMWRTISRNDLARMLISAADDAPLGTTWDVYTGKVDNAPW